jgi:hypothetical protein
VAVEDQAAPAVVRGPVGADHDVAARVVHGDRARVLDELGWIEGPAAHLEPEAPVGGLEQVLGRALGAAQRCGLDELGGELDLGVEGGVDSGEDCLALGWTVLPAVMPNRAFMGVL